jgi:hypothetical protein
MTKANVAQPEFRPAGIILCLTVTVDVVVFALHSRVVIFFFFLESVIFPVLRTGCKLRIKAGSKRREGVSPIWHAKAGPEAL